MSCRWTRMARQANGHAWVSDEVVQHHVKLGGSIRRAACGGSRRNLPTGGRVPSWEGQLLDGTSTLIDCVLGRVQVAAAFGRTGSHQLGAVSTRQTWIATSPRALASSLPVHVVCPSGAGSSNWARMRRSVPSSYTRGLPGRGASARPLNPCLANRVRHLLRSRSRQMRHVSRRVQQSLQHM